jgi:hypothetical protein
MIRQLLLVLFACAAGVHLARAEPGDANRGFGIPMDRYNSIVLNPCLRYFSILAWTSAFSAYSTAEESVGADC